MDAVGLVKAPASPPLLQAAQPGVRLIFKSKSTNRKNTKNE